MGKLKDVARSAFFRVLDATGVNMLYRSRNAHKLTILYYHGIREEDSARGTGNETPHFSGPVFRCHLEYLNRLGYRFVTMTEAVDALQSREPLPEKLVTLTFDDGYRNIVQVAYPIMKELGGKGCIYVVNNLVGTDRMLWTTRLTAWIQEVDRRHVELEFEGRKLSLPLGSESLRRQSRRRLNAALSSVDEDRRNEYLARLNAGVPAESSDASVMADWDELRALDQNVLEVGCHTCSHPSLAEVRSEEVLEREIAGSKAAIEKAMGRLVIHFCYPAGSYDERVVRNVSQCGYVSAVTTNDGFNDQNQNTFLLKRVSSGVPLRQFKACLSGAFRLYCSIARLRKR